MNQGEWGVTNNKINTIRQNNRYIKKVDKLNKKYIKEITNKETSIYRHIRTRATVSKSIYSCCKLEQELKITHLNVFSHEGRTVRSILYIHRVVCMKSALPYVIPTHYFLRKLGSCQLSSTPQFVYLSDPKAGMDAVKKAASDAVESIRNSPLFRRKFGNRTPSQSPSNSHRQVEAISPEKDTTPFVQGVYFMVSRAVRPS